MRLLNTLLFALAMLCYNNIFAQSHYVSPSGNDGNPGTFAAPWKTFQKACNSATPGSTVYLRGGTYAPAWLNVSGTSGNFVTFTNYNNETAIIDGGNTGTQTELLVISGKNYIRVQNLNFTNAIGNYSAGIYISNGSHHIEIINNKVYNIKFSDNPSMPVNASTNSYPLIVYNEHASNAVHHLLINSNEIYDCRTGYSEALSLGGNVDGFEVSNNEVHDNTNIGIDITGGYNVSSNPLSDMARNGVVKENLVYNCVNEAPDIAAGIYVDGGHNVIVERNISHHNGRGFEVGCEEPGHETTGIIVRDNIAYYNKQPGIGIGGYDYPSTGKVTDSQILNNTFYHNNTDNVYEGEILVEYTENCTINNNIFYAANTQKILMVTRLNSIGLSLDYNLFYHPDGASNAIVDWEGDNWPPGFANYQSTSEQDANSVFDNPAGNDYSLTLTSPAINAGSPFFSPDVDETDFDGNNRVVGARVDIGAFEYAGQCYAPLNITSNISSTAFHHAQTNITADNTINSSADVTYTAGNSILLEEGFDAKVGATFYAGIEDCD